MNGIGCNAHRRSDGAMGVTLWVPAARGETEMRQVHQTVADALALIEGLVRMVREDVMRG